MLICQKNKSIAHRDIKPENVLIQKNASLHNVSYIHMAKVCKTRGLRQTESSVESTVLTVVQRGQKRRFIIIHVIKGDKYELKILKFLEE
ncbi:unnamed protein product [Oikopleura dioica]|uniref:Protein kinase domain-containing protein n=1 Tax=Oikopleura dioica TaxID=34765 RepID=E4WVR2_OIKDI|nr:unnamed protein product [Oikopleura dioica]